MNAFTHGMFGELQNYEDRKEFEAWLDVMDDEVDDDWTDILQRHEYAADALEMERPEAAREEAYESVLYSMGVIANPYPARTCSERGRPRFA